MTDVSAAEVVKVDNESCDGRSELSRDKRGCSLPKGVQIPGDEIDKKLDSVGITEGLATSRLSCQFVSAKELSRGSKKFRSVPFSIELNDDDQGPMKLYFFIRTAQ